MNIQSDPSRLQHKTLSVPTISEVPIRATFADSEGLRRLGERLARGESELLKGLKAFDLDDRIKENAEKILAVYRSTNAAQARGEPITPAANWLLDNNYVVEDAILQIKRDLPRRFYRELPTLDLPDGGRVPRVLALAWLYVAHCDSAVSAETFAAIVQGFQVAEPLRIGELWALPSVLRFVLVENLRRLALRVRRAHELRAVANQVADEVLAAGTDGDGVDVLKSYVDLAREPTFATQLLYRLRDGSQNAGRALLWLEYELEKAGTDAEEVTIAEHATLSSGNVTTGNIIRGLRLVNDVDWTLWFEGVSTIDSQLKEHTDYALLDFSSRNLYRNEIEKLARRSGLTEAETTQRAIAMAREAGEAEGAPVDIGFFLVGPRREEFERSIAYKAPLRQRCRRFYRSAGWLGMALPVAVLTVLFLMVAAFALEGIGLSTGAIACLLILFSLPATEAAVSAVNTLALLLVNATRLVGYEYKDGVPADQRTLVVVPTLIGSRDDVEEAVHNLEVHYLANMTGELSFAVLSDWPDSREERSNADMEVLDFARKSVAELNARYPREGTPRFHLLHRRRLYNETEGRWMGWERKRGKLHELNLLLRGDLDTTFMAPDSPLPENVVHVMTLDADTRTTRDAVTRLVGKLAHPLNRPAIDAAGRRITAGYGILQPRVTASLTTGDEASFFQRVFSSNRGLDPYVFAVSDVYQDIFGEGSFTGKGLYHIDAVEAALKERLPENAVLSHDLLEGALARCALVTDVEVVEDYPTRYAVDASRHHRWARGDWQLLPFIFGANSGVPGLSRWKMVDNLRRSLTPIFWVAASIAGWTLLPFTQAAQWQALLILSLFIAPTFDLIDRIMPRVNNAAIGGHVNSLMRDVAFATAQVAFRVVLIADNAWSMADAIGRTLYRMFVSRRHLLEWRTASQANKNSADDIASYYRMMSGSVVIAGIGLAVPMAAGSTGVVIAFFFSLFWIGSPAFAWLVSRSAKTEDRLEVEPEDAAKLRVAARRTWLYFETFVTAEQNMLPPDNFQEVPAPIVAHRTSPTNIGVYLLSIVSARDFGWLSLANAVERLEKTMTTMEKMKRFNGHLFNWYDTKTLNPLYPLYVSSVDSGNLAGHLIAVSAACRDWSQAPAAHLQGDFTGILDVNTIIGETLEDLADDRRQLRPLRQRLKERIEGMRRAVDAITREPETAAFRTINLAVLSGEIRKLASALHAETGSAASEQLSLWAAKLEATCEAHVSDAHTDDKGAGLLRRRLEKLTERTRRFAFEMDFSFLLRADRKLLSIGYRVEEHQLDEACYDLLASEARLTSLFAIAKGDLPTEHWFKLGRPLTEIGFRGALVSWSGSMFEYLMPPLVMKEPQGGILNQTSNLVIRKQIGYGRSKGIPWGISEAAYNARDREMTYQYTNFGVPGLGLKRGLAQNTVIAPYATVLASQFKPREAVENMERMRDIGGLGRYGYYDAIDFTPERVPENAEHAVVRNYYAHHQGMTIAAVGNAVFDGRMRDRFHSDPVVEAAELLLQEKAPRDIPLTTIRVETEDRVSRQEVQESPDLRVVIDPLKSLPTTNLMSNGHYSVMVSATGAGYSRFNELAVTRWQADPTEDRNGTFLFVADTESGEWWSATAEPKRAEGEVSRAFFSDDKATFVKSVGTLRSEVECIVASEGDGEARRITLINDGMADRYLEVTSFGEIVLAPEAADSAHPAFSKMFVETEIVEKGGLILARRRKRAENEPDIALAHFVASGAGVARETEAETDRYSFIGRGRSIANAAAFEPGARLGGNDGFVMDPVFSLRCRVRVPASKKVSLTFWTIVGPSTEEVEQSVERLSHSESFQRQSMLAWTRSQVQTRHVGLTLAEAAIVQKLARYLIYPSSALRSPSEAIASGLGRQSALWPTSISGDFPIFALRIGNVADIEIVASALRMQEYLRARGLLADLVIVNEQAASYVQDLQQAIESMCENSRLRGKELGPRQHIFAVRRDLMDEDTYRTLLAAARVVLHTRNGPIADQIERAEASELQARTLSLSELPAAENNVVSFPASATRSIAPARPAADGELAFWNGYGGFDESGRDYVIRLDGDKVTPHPWINVISNEDFGFHTSAEGASFTWSRNSRDFQLTPWTNDPVTNRPGEAFYIFDRDSNSAFAPIAAVVRDPNAVYEARHGQGVSVFTSRRGTVSTELTQLVDPRDPVKVSRLTIRNEGGAKLRLRVYAYAEWLLGNNRARTAPYTVPAYDAAGGVVTARNRFSLDYGDRVAFLAGDMPGGSVTCDRGEFIGVEGSVEFPEAVLSGSALSGSVEAGGDPCAAIARDIDIAPGTERSIVWLLGDAGSQEDAVELVHRHRTVDFEKRLADNEETWRGFLDTLQVETPDKALDAMVNNWLPYQSLACRIQARSAFYQASGAYGFRDQLQDTLALLLHDPSLARGQILNAAGRQFPEGDVQHWWLPRTGAGVRTMISDDVVWLAYAVHHYVDVTGDGAILDEQLPFIEGPALKQDEHDAFFTPEKSREAADLYEHCARALDLAVKRTSKGGLPLILGGDWNDGMNRVGEKGRGESVWLGWFLLKALGDFDKFARLRKDKQRQERWSKHATALKKALERSAWDGDWYRRGTYDDGTPLGSKESGECRIDSIAQSWSVLSGEGDEERSGIAMRSATDLLVDDKLGIARLFTPPFLRTEKEPGYIKGYPPGVRENGGQYTHAATWLVIALAEIGRANDAHKLFSMLNPVNHALEPAAADTYRVEPYVVAADVYSEGDKAGRGGWTWYTGSAGWLYRAAVEGILGLKRQGETMHVRPAMPDDWGGFSAVLRVDDAEYRIEVKRNKADSEPSVFVNGRAAKGGSFALSQGDGDQVAARAPA
ncbi:glucoamylase family protein [Aquamicrobium sp. LC103]|uniref:GH36-type glycosyl hydrolase domain-containing protein n=1 Tax=Aquamicrobium sp. LC103 TaxID=1120658 RepID=UPI00063E71E8|nr:glucoamylase family protein [Aquamicrobium sp. LC103]TKT82678.1 protein ndvB [Aquamicrobium sp. LC103]